MAAGLCRVFTLEADGRPVLAFEASNFREAQQLCKERWLRDDLMALKSAGAPLGTALSKLSARLASPEEAIIFDRAVTAGNPQSDDLILAYLVELDNPDDVGP